MRVLYVEDEPFLSKIVKESLETRGFEVALVDDGLQVITELERFQPDICVLDVMLPHRDGFSVGREIRQRRPALPIIFVTAKNQTADVLEGFESGGNDYLRKPFSVEELIVRMRHLCGLMRPAAEAALPDSIKMGRYVFYPLRQALEMDGQSRQLSYREAQLLEILSRRTNEAIPRKEILQAVWGNDSIFNSRNLDVYITRLREYLRDDPGVQLLTLKGVGYRLVCG